MHSNYCQFCPYRKVDIYGAEICSKCDTNIHDIDECPKKNEDTEKK